MEQQQQQQTSLGIEVDEEFNDQCLEAHNRYRDLHGCPPLTLSNSLAVQAQMWANHLADLGRLQHSPNSGGKFGENVAMKMVMGSQQYTGAQATAQWYSEIEFYDFEGDENQMRCGHFSQVVWKGTTEVGFGKAQSPDGKMWAVGQYTPPGNFMNKWMANIPAPVSGKADVPSRADIMGEQQQQQQQPTKTVTKRSSNSSNSNLPAGLQMSLSSGSASAQLPEPHSASDRQVGKATKTKIVNGERTVTVTLTFVRSDGSRYQVSKETVTQPEDVGQVKQQPMTDTQMIQPMRMRRNFAAPPSSASPDFDESPESLEFRQEVLDLHNEFRSRHGCPALVRSESLEQMANVWAGSLCQKRDLSHSGGALLEGTAVGQNIAMRAAGAPAPAVPLSPAAQLLHQWYGEGGGFRFGVNQPLDIRGGHFTQLLWRSSRKLGIGCATDSDTGDMYAVCFYHPCGNVQGEFADNVPAEL